MTPTSQEPPAGTRIQRSYVYVVIVWVATLVALYVFQEYFL